MAHGSHSEIVNRLKRADGHLHTIIAMIEDRRRCLEVTQQLHAIEKAIAKAKQIYIHDHIDNCLEEAVGPGAQAPRNALAEFKEIAKYL
ncbi:MAG TPA: metal-sensing transcriptional repressor [Candidatus Binataceae bacterium]|nr:metal-sensing transcriptional repressor [Candidatus Binataceae bacterium]